MGRHHSIDRFLDSEGRLAMWPKKRSDRSALLAHLAALFEVGRTYKEREVNSVLNAAHIWNDAAFLRRMLYDAGLLDRAADGSQYWRPAPTDAGREEP
jgi:hypothetical protein